MFGRDISVGLTIGARCDWITLRWELWCTPDLRIAFGVYWWWWGLLREFITADVVCPDGIGCDVCPCWTICNGGCIGCIGWIDCRGSVVGPGWIGCNGCTEWICCTGIYFWTIEFRIICLKGWLETWIFSWIFWYWVVGTTNDLKTAFDLFTCNCLGSIIILFWLVIDLYCWWIVKGCWTNLGCCDKTESSL